MFFNPIGVAMTITRLSEPYVWTNLKADLSKWFNCKREKVKRAKYSKESLDSFLNSAMNIEYVFLVLKGINFMLDKNDIYKKGNGQKIRITKSLEQTVIKFDQVDLKNMRDWSVTSKTVITDNTKSDMQTRSN